MFELISRRLAFARTLLAQANVWEQLGADAAADRARCKARSIMTELMHYTELGN